MPTLHQRRTLKALGWSLGGRGVEQVIRFGGALLLARLLLPDAFGVFAMAFAVVGIAEHVVDLGLSTAIVQREGDTVERELTGLFWLSLAVAGVGGAMTWGLSPVWGRLFDDADVGRWIAWLAPYWGLAALVTAPRAHLQRRLEHRGLAFAELSGTLAGLALAFGVVWRGGGVEALIAQLYGRQVVVLGVTAAHARWRPRGRPELGRLRALRAFSGHVLAVRAMHFVASRISSAVIGGRWGAWHAGLYDRSLILTTSIATQVSGALGAVMFPAMAARQDRDAVLREVVARAVGLLAWAAALPAVALFVLADHAVLWAFGPQWGEAGPIVRALSVGAWLAAVGPALGWITLAKGAGGIMWRWEAFATTVRVAILVVAIPHGPLAVAIGASAGLALLVPLGFHVSGKLIGLSVLALGARVWRTLVGAVLAGAVGTAMLSQSDAAWSPLAAVAVISLTFLGWSALAQRAMWRELRSIWGALRP